MRDSHANFKDLNFSSKKLADRILCTEPTCLYQNWDYTGAGLFDFSFTSTQRDFCEM